MAIVLSLPAGRYSIRVEMPGFRQINLSDVLLLSGETRDLGRLLLEVGTLAREYGFTDYDGSRPDWGRHKIDFSVLPQEWIDLFRTGTDLELTWLTTLAARTRRFKAKIPSQKRA